MKRYITPVIFVVVIGALTAYYLVTGGSSAPVTPGVPNEMTGPLPSTQRGTPQSGTGAGDQASQKYTDGTYTGNVEDAFYGNVQVQAVIKDGKIVDVIFLQHPSERDRSVLVNAYAMPLLKAQAVAAQNANVDGVSGASATSGAFVQSLQSALDQAAKA